MTKLLAALGLLLLLSVSFSGTVDALSKTCLPAPFPSTPQAPVFSLDLTDSLSTAHVHLDLWRQPCADGSGQTVALTRLTPLSTAPTICDFSLFLVQGDQQFRATFTGPPGSFVFCDKLFVPVTFALVESLSPTTFDAAKAFTLISDGKTIQQVAVPAISSFAAPPTITVVALALQPLSLWPGRRLPR